jgi:exonuclease III
LGIQNFNSINISKPGTTQAKKIKSTIKDNMDVILISDLRLNSTKNKHSVHSLEKQFFNLGYEFIHNSKHSSRGVGILINKKLSLAVQNSWYDANDNYLLIKVNHNGINFIIGAVYGPNHNEPTFFDNLERDLLAASDNNQLKIITGGDWNATWDTRVAANNCDVINMNSIPSNYRSEKLNTLAARLDLTDPYRYLNPLTKDYTYVPNARANINRSRIDFFLVTRSVCCDLKKCEIEYSTRSNVFDHKRVNLITGTVKKNSDRTVIKIKFSRIRS